MGARGPRPTVPRQLRTSPGDPPARRIRSAADRRTVPEPIRPPGPARPRRGAAAAPVPRQRSEAAHGVRGRAAEPRTVATATRSSTACPPSSTRPEPVRPHSAARRGGRGGLAGPGRARGGRRLEGGRAGRAGHLAHTRAPSGTSAGCASSILADSGPERPRVLVIAGAIVGDGMAELLADPRIETIESDVVVGPRRRSWRTRTTCPSPTPHSTRSSPRRCSGTWATRSAWSARFTGS